MKNSKEWSVECIKNFNTFADMLKKLNLINKQCLEAIRTDI